MTLQRASLRSFLVSAKVAAKGSVPRSTPVTFVVGNESADLDSICSALVYAYVRSQIPPYDQHIPLSNLAREDISLRPELKPVLSKAQIQPEDLITLSDLPHDASSAEASSITRVENAHLVLVDHNALTGALSEIFNGQVVGCIDHHEDEGVVPGNHGVEPRVIQKSGSCASLVVAECRRAWETTNDSQESAKQTDTWDAELAQIALAPILIDTNNLQDEHKTSEADEQAVKFLLERSGSGCNRDSYFREISEAKQDIGDLNLDDILRKDYKMWEESGRKLGVSSAVKDLSFLVDKAGSDNQFLRALRQFAKARSLSLFALMTTSDPNGVFTRELLVLGLGHDAIRICRNFEEHSSITLGLKIWRDGRLDQSEAEGWSKCWIQEKVEHSRKQVGPLLRKAMN